ncbi:MAG: DUF192 domain-containing protein [Coriobacteriales bacterium]|jgi:uncharacterized membrane protein (UPF0127 family)|nr:DUF192 domain-containing protein [Coriobacteriales bacterium]
MDCIDQRTMISHRVRVANRLFSRLLGLKAKGVMNDVDALLLDPCYSIHSYGMPTDIDVAFIDKQGRVLKSLRNLPPRRLASCHGARATLERFSDPTSSWFSEGEMLVLSYLDDKKVPAIITKME